ncbi:aldehyde dehydrogenase family protein, partial [Pantoea sp. SIMBA_133]
ESTGAIFSAKKEDVDLAVSAAREAFDHGPWKGTTRKERARILRDISQLILDHQDELATLESLDNGKLYTEAYNDDVQEASDLFQ